MGDLAVQLNAAYNEASTHNTVSQFLFIQGYNSQITAVISNYGSAARTATPNMNENHHFMWARVQTSSLEKASFKLGNGLAAKWTDFYIVIFYST